MDELIKKLQERIIELDKDFDNCMDYDLDYISGQIYEVEQVIELITSLKK